MGLHIRGDWLKIWIARQPRSTPRSIAFGSPPAGETCAPISTACTQARWRLACAASYEGSLRAISHGRAAHRRRSHRAVQLAARAPRAAAQLRAAHRGHRPRALDAREHRADPRRAALAGARLGRGADPPDASAPSATARRCEALLAAGHAYRSRATAEDVQGLQAAATAPSAASAARPRPRAPCACACPPRARPSCTTSIRGDTRFEHVHLDDPVIARADGSVLYNFAVAIDDLDAGITHVVRGEDHLSNTPKQLLVLEAASAAGLGSADSAAAAVRAPAAAARARRQEAVKAPRRGLRAGAARRRLPARGGAQLPRAARLGRRRRRHRALHRGADRALHARARQPQPRALRRGQAEVAGRPVHPPAAGRRADPAPGSVHRARGPRGRWRGSARRRSTRSPTSGRWRARCSTARVEDPKARERWLDEDGRAALAEVRAALAADASFDEAPSGEALAAVVAQRAAKPREVYQPLRVAISGAHGLARDLRERRAARPRGDAAAHRSGSSRADRHVTQTLCPEFVHDSWMTIQGPRQNMVAVQRRSSPSSESISVT